MFTFSQDRKDDKKDASGSKIRQAYTHVCDGEISSESSVAMCYSDFPKSQVTPKVMNQVQTHTTVSATGQDMRWVRPWYF